MPDAKVEIDLALLRLQVDGPSPLGYKVKTLGKSKGQLWQLNLKVNKQQIRILYAPYGNRIVIYRIHKKSSEQEQERAYSDAMRRKKEAELKMKLPGHENAITLH